MNSVLQLDEENQRLREQLKEASRPENYKAGPGSKNEEAMPAAPES